MGDEGTFATTAEVQNALPSWVNSTYNTEAVINYFIKDWEAYICNAVSFDFVSNYASANTLMKRILARFVISKVCMDICDRDTTGAAIRTAEFYFDSMTRKADQAESEIKKNMDFIRTGK